MGRMGYEYGTTPRKLEPNYRPSTSRKKDIQKQVKINERQKKEALKLERKKHNKNVALVMAIFLILLAVSYRSSLINEKFNEIQTAKEQLASIEKTNGQLQVSIEGSLNLSNVEEAAKEKLGMQKLDNGQKVFVTLDKKDYVEAGTQDISITEETNDTWFEKVIKKIFNK